MRYGLACLTTIGCLLPCSVPHKLCPGEPRDSTLADQPEIAALFPNLTSGENALNLAHLQACDPQQDPEGATPLTVGVVLSGGQAAGG